MYPAKEACSRCGLCDTYYVAHVKDACAFLGDGVSLQSIRHCHAVLAVPGDKDKVRRSVMCRHVQDREARAAGARARAVRFRSACCLSPVMSIKLELPASLLPLPATEAYVAATGTWTTWTICTLACMRR